MATNVTGSPTTAVAPSPLPQEQSFPIANCPDDGDPLTAASVRQALSAALMDVAFLKLPRNVASAVTPIRKTMNVLLQTMAVIDHLGFPGGKLVTTQENWPGQDLYNTANTNGRLIAANRWMYTLTGAAGGILVQDPAAAEIAMSRSLLLQTPGAGVSGDVSVEMDPQVIPSDDVVIMVQADFKLTAASNLTVNEHLFGLQGNSLVTIGGAWGTVGTGFAIAKLAGTTNYQAIIRTAAGALTTTDTGVASTGVARRRFRIEYFGKNRTGDNVERVCFYIDGALVVNTPISLVMASYVFRPFARSTHTGSGTAGVAQIGVVDYRQNTWAGDLSLGF